MHPKNISIQDFTYNLPNEKIALHPLPERDASKLLIYKNGNTKTDYYKNIADYLSKNWSERTKIEFLILLTEKMKLISTMPYLYKASQKQFNIRECVMNKHTILYYRVLEETIEIITIRNTRQKPEEF